MRQVVIDWLITLSPLFAALLPAFLAWLTVLVRSAFDHMPSKERQIIRDIVTTGVAAVMQAHPELTNEQKKEQALQYIEAQLARFHINVGRDVLDPILEEAVLLVKIAMGDATVPHAMQAPKRDAR